MSNNVDIRRLVPPMAGIVTVMALFAISYRHGPALAPDSIDYLSAGLYISEGRGAITYDGSPLTSFPPLLPLLIALGERLGVSGTQTAAFVNLLAMMIIVCGVFILLRRRVANPTVVSAGTMIAAGTSALFHSARFVGSDTLFVAIVVIWLCLADRIANEERADWIAVTSLGVVGGLSVLIRYAGVSLVVSGLVVLLVVHFRRRAHMSRAMYGKFGVYLAISCSPPALWMLRNYLADGTWMGARAPASISPIEIGRRMVSTFGSWLVPLPPSSLTFGVAILALVAFVAIRRVAPSAQGEHRPGARVIFDPLVVFFSVYLCYLALAAWSTAFDPIGVRLLSPVFVPALILTLQWADGVVSGFPKSSRRLFWVPIAASLLVIGNVSVSAAKAVKMAREGNGFALVEFREGPLSEQVERLGDVLIVSNDGRAVWSLRREDDAYDIPRPEWYRTPEAYRSALLDMIELISCRDGEVYLVLWSDQPSAGLSEPVVSDALSWMTISDDWQGALALISHSPTTRDCAHEDGTPE